MPDEQPDKPMPQSGAAQAEVTTGQPARKGASTCMHNTSSLPLSAECLVLVSMILCAPSAATPTLPAEAGKKGARGYPRCASFPVVRVPRDRLGVAHITSQPPKPATTPLLCTDGWIPG